jgi:hypothetical protein
MRNAKTNRKAAKHLSKVSKVTRTPKGGEMMKVQSSVAVQVDKEPTPENLLALAINAGRSMEEIKALIELRNDEIKRIARLKFIDAKKAFQKMCPPVRKNRTVEFDHKKDDGKTEYSFAELAEITETIREAADLNGFTYDWKTRYEGKNIFVTCILSHAGGHTESDEMKGEADSSGKKSVIQADASTISYLRRYTLMGVLGLSARGDDRDGRGTPMPQGGGGTVVDDWALLHKPTTKEFNDALGRVSRKEITVGDVEAIYRLTDEQLDSLKTAAQ